MEYIPEVVNFQVCVSSTSGCSTTFESSSHRWRYSIRTGPVNAPLISEIHLPPIEALKTVLFLALAAIELNRCGRVCSRLWSSSHQSVQKRVFLPFPITVSTAIAKKDWIWGKKSMIFHVLFSVTQPPEFQSLAQVLKIWNAEAPEVHDWIHTPQFHQKHNGCLGCMN